MASEFRMVHRVEFADTDMAGIVYFGNYFRYMEMTEHAFIRSLGFSIHMEWEGRSIGWPRVHAACDFKQPLRFEDLVEVHLRVRVKKARSLTYDFTFRKLEGDPAAGGGPGVEVAHGTLTAVCVALEAEAPAGQAGAPAGKKMKAITIPEALAGRIEAANP